MSIELHIERLVIDEALLGGERASSVREAIERELTLRLAQPGVVDTLRGFGAVALLPPASHPHTRLGPRIAAAVQQGLGIALSTQLAGKEH
jgi:hypothetical protein